MDIAVLADIHSNHIAFERCVEDVLERGITTFLFLGDYIGELAYPQKTMELLYRLQEHYQCYFIRGNKEEYWINYRKQGATGWKDYNSASGALFYSYHHLTTRDLDFFEKLPIAKEIAFERMEPITICHGSPFKVNGKMIPEDEATKRVIDQVITPLILCGHTHIQSKIIYNNKKVLNPGSIGIPLRTQGKMQYLILHENQGVWEEEFVSLTYDIEKAVYEMHESGLFEHAPYWSIVTEGNLRGSNLSQSKTITRAMELCKEEMGECIWPDIPDRFWLRAIEEQRN
ncbi:hypothetical protein lbkm_0159 [Lachnospiraceae bacterium KM106-2]|nr:hypothetical protein lbkm_0159 [Lachnospiraceae bacterium KM106-2]